MRNYTADELEHLSQIVSGVSDLALKASHSDLTILAPVRVTDMAFEKVFGEVKQDGESGAWVFQPFAEPAAIEGEEA